MINNHINEELIKFCRFKKNTLANDYEKWRGRATN